MKRPSFSTQLVVLWALVAALCAVLVAIVGFMAISAESQQIAGARQQVTAACEAVASRYSLSRPLSAATGNTDLMHAVLDIVLAQEQNVEGGFWTSGPVALAVPHGATQSRDSEAAVNAPPTGFLAYAFPTYQGSGIKRDIPEAETPLILRTLRTAAATHTAAADVIRSGPDAVVAAACTVKDEPALFAWMLTRARPPLGPHGELLVTGLAAILAVILVVAVALAVTLRRWKRNLNLLESGLSLESSVEPAGQLPRLHEPELDRIVDALNRYANRAEQLRQQTADLSDKLARAERFSVLGKLAAQVAHEIRNPAGAMRLKAENALAGDSERQQGALRFILEQIGRIETQVASLLALTQPVTVKPQKVNVAGWLASVVESHRELARQRGIRLMLVTKLEALAEAPTPALPEFDPEQLRRALDNLLLNALRHVGEAGMVTVTAQRDWSAGRPHLRIAVSDNGPGVPADQRERIFEPFVTGRPDGSGLGLAVVREVASAHGGRAWLDGKLAGACFVIEIPWQPSS
ncbi:Adaptive-response sensory-kinase SasA [Paraburkholderia caffeinitolerans]|uniref:histidine kinase n=1 Tax=Paraburkholderia caffeinitolerans TaxID=1723730 RepID=A0A6J5GMX3_9BURK|nr:HAMP domain-containing sensor histidine kinase [Paraburkholderia caffeinitolerans]CAB3803802.1 Adaptive-response sensory-kinase SasA [Paraburkholderia caffeinitolerans]